MLSFPMFCKSSGKRARDVAAASLLTVFTFKDASALSEI